MIITGYLHIYSQILSLYMHCYSTDNNVCCSLKLDFNQTLLNFREVNIRVGISDYMRYWIGLGSRYAPLSVSVISAICKVILLQLSGDIHTIPAQSALIGLLV